MSFEWHRVSVTTHLNDNWTACPVAFENVSGKNSVMPYIVATMLTGETLSLIGANRFTGELVFQVITEHNKGTKSARQISDLLFTMFHNQLIDGVFYGPVRAANVGHAEGVYQINVNIPFKYDA
jgi:hypothetical protein